MNRPLCVPLGLLIMLLELASGCRKSPETAPEPGVAPPKPPQAAAQLYEAFANAPPEVRQSAHAAAEALRTSNYEQAVQSLNAMRTRPNLTPEQGMAIYNSARALEARLIAAMEAGDPNAKRAYELLRKSRRN